MKNTDLHTHSHYSDGQTSPKRLVRLAKKRGIKNLALTDHDSVKGVKEAIDEGKKIGVNVIPGVEIRTDAGEVLGYFIDIKNKELIKKLKESAQKDEDKTREWCDILNKKGYNISFERLWKDYPKARGNINAFYVIHTLYLEEGGERKEVYDNIKKSRPSKVKRMTVIQAIKLIKKARGVPVLSHPWFDSIKSHMKNMEKYVKSGLKGLEINNGDRVPNYIKKGDVKKIRDAAKKYNLILTSGSDYHGEELIKLMTGNHALGKNNCDEEVIEKLMLCKG